MMDVMLGMKLQESLSNRDKNASSEDDNLVDETPGAMCCERHVLVHAV